MERIQKAIEKARNDHSPLNTNAEPVVLRKHAEAGAVYGELATTTYSVTKTIPIDPIHLERHRIVTVNKNNPGTASFDLLRTQVVLEMEEKGWRTLAVISPTADCGKTVVAINLAISMAQQTSPTVLLADLDLRHPATSAYLGIKPESDLSDYLEGRINLAGALVNPGIPRFVVLPNSQAYQNAAEMLTSPKVRSLVKELKGRYESRIIIFDLPPILSTDDAIAFLPQVDCVLVVVGSGMTTKLELDNTLRLLTGTNLVGVVLNKSDASQLAHY